MKAEGESHRRRPANALVDGICSYLAQYQPENLLDLFAAQENGSCPSGDSQNNESANQRQDAADQQGLRMRDIPKRYTIYHPMLLLNSTFASHSLAWQHFLSTLSGDQKPVLFRTVIDKFRSSGKHITHVAMNAPIELHTDTTAQAVSPAACDGVAQVNGFDTTAASCSDENITRSPINLQSLYGDFGPDKLVSTAGSGPSQADFDAAFWVEATQLSGIRQVWAPRWTMFSRGNIREKGRILGQQGVFPGLAEEGLEQPLSEVDVVDFYVGIGYFALPYLHRGVRRVFGWEINGWSVEGLRRGCERNGWQHLIVTVDGGWEDGDRLVGMVVRALVDGGDLRCIVFHGDNRFAEEIMVAIRSALKGQEVALNVRHCNLGLLPTSKGSWQGAVASIDPQRGGWLHVHENADISQIETKRQEVFEALAVLVKENKGEEWQMSCEHTEKVKTYAPGVGHYVFDIRLWRAR